MPDEHVWNEPLWLVEFNPQLELTRVAPLDSVVKRNRVALVAGGDPGHEFGPWVTIGAAPCYDQAHLLASDFEARWSQREDDALSLGQCCD